MIIAFPYKHYKFTFLIYLEDKLYCRNWCIPEKCPVICQIYTGFLRGVCFFWELGIILCVLKIQINSVCVPPFNILNRLKMFKFYENDKNSADQVWGVLAIFIAVFVSIVFFVILLPSVTLKQIFFFEIWYFFFSLQGQMLSVNPLWCSPKQR